MKEVSIIFPALNEEETIGKIIDEVPMEEIEGRGYRAEIIVVDNGSTDKTREIAESKGAWVITEPNRGKGRAIRTAFESVSSDFVFMIDADFTYPATYIPQMLEVLEGECDVVLGSRLKGQLEEGAMSRFNLVGNYILSSLANLLYGTRVSDLCTGYWGFRGEVVKSLKLDAVGFELEANMLVEIARQGYKIAEIPILYRKRPNQAKLGSLKDGFRIGRTLIRKRFR
jgi:glycosyltransferase involved in cell wall biosynthesis